MVSGIRNGIQRKQRDLVLLSSKPPSVWNRNLELDNTTVKFSNSAVKNTYVHIMKRACQCITRCMLLGGIEKRPTDVPVVKTTALRVAVGTVRRCASRLHFVTGGRKHTRKMGMLLQSYTTAAILHIFYYTIAYTQNRRKALRT